MGGAQLGNYLTLHAILGHYNLGIWDSKNRNLRANTLFKSKRQFDIMSNHVYFVKKISVTFKTILSV